MTTDINVDAYLPLPTPREIATSTSLRVQENVARSRAIVRNIIDGVDKRKLVIIGPCSLHDVKSALEYANKLSLLQLALPELFFVMRTYFEKPRTITGWKGMLYDPDRDGSYNMEKGIRMVRAVLLTINDLGVPCACEFLDPNMPQYYADLISWGAIGARTTESQVHRQLASGLSCPVGFKNSTSGSVEYPINSVKSCSQCHVFPGIDYNGKACVIKTKGNKYCHLVLRGSDHGPNFSAEDVLEVKQRLIAAGHNPDNILIDCSHGNSGKCHLKQLDVIDAVISRNDVMGIMVESYLLSGRCELDTCDEEENYGRSVTDKCISWDQTVSLMYKYNDLISERTTAETLSKAM